MLIFYFPTPKRACKLLHVLKTVCLVNEHLVEHRRVSWFNVSGMGFCLDYQSISLHAISRDLTSYPKEHLYVMVNSKLKGKVS